MALSTHECQNLYFELELAISLYYKLIEKFCVHHAPRSNVFVQLVYVREQNNQTGRPCGISVIVAEQC